MAIEQALEEVFGILWGLMVVFFIFMVAIIVFTYVCNWKIYEKAGIPGWKCLIPFYNSYLLFQLAWGEGLYFLLLFVPWVNFVVLIILFLKLAQAFGQEDLFAVGLIFLSPIFLAILAFNKDIEYLGPITGKANKNNVSKSHRNMNTEENNYDYYD